jgi:hypothetical protein
MLAAEAGQLRCNSFAQKTATHIISISSRSVFIRVTIRFDISPQRFSIVNKEGDVASACCPHKTAYMKKDNSTCLCVLCNIFVLFFSEESQRLQD